MKEFLGRILKLDYLSKHPVEDPHIASLIRIAEKTKRGHFRGSEEYVESLRLRFRDCSPGFEDFRLQPIDLKWFSELANQLYAIEQMGESRNKQALDYLQYLSKEDVQIARRDTYHYFKPRYHS